MGFLQTCDHLWPFFPPLPSVSTLPALGLSPSALDETRVHGRLASSLPQKPYIIAELYLPPWSGWSFLHLYLWDFSLAFKFGWTGCGLCWGVKDGELSTGPPGLPLPRNQVESTQTRSARSSRPAARAPCHGHRRPRDPGLGGDPRKRLPFLHRPLPAARLGEGLSPTSPEGPAAIPPASPALPPTAVAVGPPPCHAPSRSAAVARWRRGRLPGRRGHKMASAPLGCVLRRWGGSVKNGGRGVPVCVGRERPPPSACRGRRLAGRDSRGLRANNWGPHLRVCGHLVGYENKEGSRVIWRGAIRNLLSLWQ